MSTEHEPTPRGLPGIAAPDPATAERERAWLVDVAQRPLPARAFAFLRAGGPAYLQSALTLGGGTVSAAVLSGATFGHALLWVAPVAMLIGVVMLAALSHQTLSTGMDPLDAMRRFAGCGYAWLWAIGALLASIIWHFPQYALGSSVVVDLGAVSGVDVPKLPAAFAILAWSILSSQLYGSRTRWMRLLERGVVLLVWSTILCFLVVVVSTGFPDPGAIARGFVAFEIPADRGDIRGVDVALAGLAAAVVVNMVFLYPYTLLARGWGREHRQRARYDLGFGLFVPYVLAVSLVVIAMANTVHLDAAFSGRRLSPIEAAQCFTGLLGDTAGRVMFDLGILGMVLTTVTMHMVCAGFACSRLLGLPFGSVGHRLAMLLPAPGVFGAVWWGDIGVYVAVPTSILCGLLLPVVYVGIWKLHRSDTYLGADRPRGWRAAAWSAGMTSALVVVVAFVGWYLATSGIEYFTGGR